MKVVLYTTGCPKCKILKKKLEELRIEYEEFTDTNEMINLDIEDLPQLSVGGIFLDFQGALLWLKGK